VSHLSGDDRFHSAFVRVTMVAESFLPRVNGVSGSILRAARHLVARDHHVDIIAPAPAPSHLLEGPRVHSVRSVTIPGMAVDLGYATTGRLSSLLDQLEPDVVHLASPLVLGHQVLRVARQADLPTVAVYQTDISGFARHYRLTTAARLADALIRRVHSHSDLTLAPSTASRDYLVHLGVPHVRMWGRGVDSEQFDPARRSDRLRQQWTAGESRVIVGYIGRLAPEKRVEMLAAVTSDPRIHLVIVGDGPQRNELRDLLPQATFTGLLTGADLGAAAASMDVIVAPGERETFCQVVQEAMASGVPVVAPDIGGPRDLIDHGITGLLYAPGDVSAMARNVSRLIENPLERAVMGRRGRAFVAGRTWERTGDELIDHYRTAIGLSGRHTSLAA